MQQLYLEEQVKVTEYRTKLEHRLRAPKRSQQNLLPADHLSMFSFSAFMLNEAPADGVPQLSWLSERLLVLGLRVAVPV
ncbi:hypothetical protein T4E_8826 [Trichinella pseudospiralis]|uniref:Uncharacterized protein n=1 Tax=Trichinella pseudospiralis TaxID=6337 RepID=A0A0V0XYP5_TRIPS|nr:hypothetical protein T4E_8826 [Trichinella pseudospiralis]